jgi:hypothetical protein
MTDVEKKFEQLLKLKDGWDSYGGKAPHPVALARARTVATHRWTDQDPCPAVVACSDGSVALTWRIGDHVEVNVVAKPDGSLELGVFDESRWKRTGDQKDRDWAVYAYIPG